MSDTPIYDQLLEFTRRGKTLAQPRDLFGRPVPAGTRARKATRPVAAAAGAVAVLAEHPRLRIDPAHGGDLGWYSTANGIATAVLWNA